MHSTLVQESAVSTPAERSWLPIILLGTIFGWLWFFLCRQLSYEWSANEQYSYGWFVPFFAAFLFWLRWEEGGGQGESSRNAGEGEAGRSKAKVEISRPQLLLLFTFYFLLFLLLPTRLFEAANADWRPLSWVHAFAVVGLSLLVIGYSGGVPAVRHFAFPVCFILVAVPWITPIEEPIVQGLMRLVAAVATEALTLCGIPAQLEGSLIRVSSGVVGVSEACSGVRSLQTSLMIGLLLGELKRLTMARRFALVGAALTLALMANFVRAFFLVWIAATQNLAAVAHWHDLAGYAIIGIVFLGTVAIAQILARGTRSGGLQPPKGDFKSPLRLPSSLPLSTWKARPRLRLRYGYFLLSTFSWLLLVEASVSGWYRWHERDFVATPRWTVRWPEYVSGFHDVPIDDAVRSTLRYQEGREAMWPATLTLPSNEKSATANLTMFFFHWVPGSTSTLRARAHRPDICLPPIGWIMTNDDGVRNYAISNELKLPFRHFRFTRKAGDGHSIFVQAFFCEHEDRALLGTADQSEATSGTTLDWNRSDRVRVVRQGMRNQGQQVMELVVMTPNEISRADAESAFARMLPSLVIQNAENLP
ncbi:MAG: exosortase/archaeosortase family protein [Chthoniobacterales bacterium]|nr:exosortase/archaeosortase family protein [Chthoniobacterales bacterium]